MGSILILSPEVRGKIAAGEVITRPASVVKELIENAIDAQATRIDVAIRDGGKIKVLVNDDGNGISPDDVDQAIERFGTSKIRTVNDIEHIATYGFRGEALASIAQVSRLDLETSDGTTGTKLVVYGGVTKEKARSFRSRGTRVVVADLFHNLPVRLKFLKSAQWERKLIMDLIRSYALICSSVHFTLSDGDREVFNFPSSVDPQARLKMIVPRALYDAMVPIKARIGSVSVKGQFARPDFQERHHVHFLSVNTRPVTYPRLYRTIMQVYQEPKNPPAYVLHIEVAPDQVDINIHPTKKEVKFRDERYIVDVLTQVLKKQIFKMPSVFSSVSPSGHTLPISASSDRFVQDTMIPYSTKTTALGSSRDVHEFWQVHNMYILAQTSSGLIVVDQHAAHERIIYEAIMKGKSGSQRLLFPITIDLTPEEYRAYKKTKIFLKDFGIDFKEFSSRTVVVDSVPANTRVDRADFAGLFKDIDGLGNLIKEKSEIAKVIACHAAIKAGQRLSEIEMQDLIDKLFACERPYTCPHGRPTVIRFSMDELANRFGRT